LFRIPFVISSHACARMPTLRLSTNNPRASDLFRRRVKGSPGVHKRHDLGEDLDALLAGAAV
jgi:hypothetical protein